MIPVEEWQAYARSLAVPLRAVEVPVEDAHGCVLAADVVAAVQVPGFDNSAMDGYAVRRADVLGATEQTPVELPVDGDVPAGLTRRTTLAPGHALRIMTGAPMPEGADAVVQVEHTDGGTTRVRVDREPAEHMHVRQAGTDVALGAPVLPAGTYVGAHQLALLVSVGVARVPVVPVPRVVVLTTGDELVDPGATAGFGQVVDSNGPSIVAALRESGFTATRRHATGDTEADVAAAVRAAIADADAVITTGGVSMGAYDPVKAVLRTDLRFDKVAMQPGKPQGAGVLDADGRDVPVFCLPGNPVSALVSYHVVVEDALRVLAGRAPLSPWTPARAAEEWRSPLDRAQYVRVTIDADGVRLAGGQGSYQLTAMALADGIACVPVGVDRVRPGDELLVRRLR